MAEINPEIPAKSDPLGTSDSKIRKSLVTIREAINGELDNTNLSGTAGITRANLLAESKPVKWYAPKVIATEQSRTSTEFGTLETADEIKEVVVPENGLVLVSFRARLKASVGSAGRIALFLGANQLKNASGSAQETSMPGDQEGLEWQHIFTSAGAGFALALGETADASTGQMVGAGPIEAFVAAGTYNIAVKFRSTSGSITAKERKLFVRVSGTTA